MADHNELVAELALVEKMSTQDRLKHAKKRRNQQLKKFTQYERQLEKEANKKHKKHQGNKKPQAKKQRTSRVIFDNNVMLLEAAARNDIDEVRSLLEKGVSPDVTNEDGLTALHQCCIDDSEVMMKLLIEFGANVNARDSELWTPLHAAATCGHIHLCKYLIDKGAELLSVNADGNMPYDICEDETTLDFIESEMAKRGVTQELIDEMRLSREKQMLSDLKMLGDKNGDLEFRDRNGATPLHISAANGYIQVVEFLLDQHVSLDLRDDDSWLPIHAAACWGQLAILEMLVHNGADLDAKTKNGETPQDICEEPEMKQRIIELRDEIEHNRATKSSELRHRRSQNTRSSLMSNSASSLYNSSTSLAGDKNPLSASVRRTSMRDKSAISWKEAREEAKMMRSSAASDDEEEDKNGNKAKKIPQETPNVLSPPEPGVPVPPATATTTTAQPVTASTTPTPPKTTPTPPKTTPTPPKTTPTPPKTTPKTTPTTTPTATTNKLPAQPKQESVAAPKKTVIIEKEKERVPATNIDDVKIHMNKSATKQPHQHHKQQEQPASHTRDSVSAMMEEKERERQKNEANALNSAAAAADAAAWGERLGRPAIAPPAAGTLADLKKQRQQQLQNQLQKSKSGLSIDMASNGNGSLPQNGHSPNLSTSGRSSPAATTPTSPMYFPPPPQGEPPKHRFTATQPSEIVGDNGKQNCCVIL